MTESPLRRTASFTVVLIFLVVILSFGIGNELSEYAGLFPTNSDRKYRPDFAQYIHVRDVSANDLSLDQTGRRAIVIGDIHGMDQAFHALLENVSYDSKVDTLIHTGDICAKGPHDGSLSVLSYMSSHNVTGVRGNHDQMVIEWRAWLDWVQGLENGYGGRWLQEAEAQWEKDNKKRDEDEEKWTKKQKKHARGKDRKWWERIPDGWAMFSDHYNIARAMSKADYEYLRSLPLILHLPSEHTFIVHAGLLPHDPTHSITDRRQPLSHLPSLSKTITDSSLLGIDWPANVRMRPTVPIYRQAQEVNLIQDIPQNTDPWVLLNMRSLRKDNKVTKSSKTGKPWADIWNEVMPQCKGFGDTAAQSQNSKLRCHPSTIIYGHAASRGLDVNRWTIGLDSGCVYGRRLTAMILEAAHKHKSDVVARADDEDDKDDETDAAKKTPKVIDFGDDGEARLVSVRCKEQ